MDEKKVKEAINLLQIQICTLEEQKEYDEAEYTNGGTVELELVSVQKDLKIKFTNKKSGKLISNVPSA